MNIYILELESEKDREYISRRIATRLISLTNMTGPSKIEAGDDFLPLLKKNSHFFEAKDRGSEVGYLAGNPVYYRPEIAGFIKLGDETLKIVFE